MPYTLSEAAAATGHNRSAIFKAIKKGALSAHRDEATGHWLVDAAELHRLYPVVMPGGSKGTAGNGQEMADNGGELREVRARLADALSQVDDLKRRLDKSEDERRATAEKLTALLSDSRPAPAAPDQRAAPARHWWPWGRRA